jgi:hypothetical protein
MDHLMEFNPSGIFIEVTDFIKISNNATYQVRIHTKLAIAL